MKITKAAYQALTFFISAVTEDGWETIMERCSENSDGEDAWNEILTRAKLAIEITDEQNRPEASA